ncbi:Ig-like domain-containing protein [Caproiciproducens sp.]
MKKYLALLGALLILTSAVTGCKQAAAPPQSSQAETSSSGTQNAALEVWEAVSGSFVRDDSSQYNNAVLQMKYLSDSCAMFEFRLMEGSEAEDLADSLVLPAVLLVDGSGVGRYESLPDSGKPFHIDFSLSADGKRVTVTHQGEMSVSPDGAYTFTGSDLEVSEVSAAAILDHLPTAATSLNHNNGEYTLQYPESLVSGWFYPVSATFNDTGAVLAKFIVAKDLSAVYRVDDDIDPVLIFGSAQPMLSARIAPAPNDGSSEAQGAQSAPSPEQKDAEAESADPGDELPLVSVTLQNSALLTPGESDKLIAVLPWELPYTLTAKSSKPEVATVDETGAVKAVAPGETTLSGTLTADDGEKPFEITLTVTEKALPESAQSGKPS